MFMYFFNYCIYVFNLDFIKKSLCSDFLRTYLEGLAGFEPANQGFADPCLTAWL